MISTTINVTTFIRNTVNAQIIIIVVIKDWEEAMSLNKNNKSLKLFSIIAYCIKVVSSRTVSRNFFVILIMFLLF